MKPPMEIVCLDGAQSLGNARYEDIKGPHVVLQKQEGGLDGKLQYGAVTVNPNEHVTSPNQPMGRRKRVPAVMKSLMGRWKRVISEMEYKLTWKERAIYCRVKLYGEAWRSHLWGVQRLSQPM